MAVYKSHMDAFEGILYTSKIIIVQDSLPTAYLLCETLFKPKEVGEREMFDIIEKDLSYVSLAALLSAINIGDISYETSKEDFEKFKKSIKERLEHERIHYAGLNELKKDNINPLPPRDVKGMKLFFVNTSRVSENLEVKGLIDRFIVKLQNELNKDSRLAPDYSNIHDNSKILYNKAWNAYSNIKKIKY